MLPQAIQMMHDNKIWFAEPGPNPRFRAEIFRRVKVGRAQMSFEPGYHLWLLDCSLPRTPIAHQFGSADQDNLIEIAQYWVETGEVLVK